MLQIASIKHKKEARYFSRFFAPDPPSVRSVNVFMTPLFDDAFCYLVALLNDIETLLGVSNADTLEVVILNRKAITKEQLYFYDRH